MKKWLIRAGFGLLGLVLLAMVAVVVLSRVGDRKAQRRLDVQLQPLALRSDAAALERGAYLFRSRGCTECHGVDGGGKDVVNDGKGMRIHAPNITPAPGTVVAQYRTEDWDRSIRHGVAPNGRPLIVMPSEDYNRLTDADFGALVGYLRQMPAAEGGGAAIELPLIVRALYGAGAIGDAAGKIDHLLPAPQPVPEAVSDAHGAYVANTCIGCHGEGLSGGKIPGAPPEWPAAANLTPGAGSVMVSYPDANAFVAMMRSGQRPSGSAVSKVMPFQALAQMSDTDLQAVYLHLKRLPARAAGSR